jgi:hypothetical protein
MSATAEFSAHVPREEYEFFREVFPQYGASKWFIVSALVEFNKQVRENPKYRELVNDAIAEMLAANRETTDAPNS